VLHSPLLRGYWPLENSAVDASGRGNNGTLVGGAGYTRGKLGQGIHLASGGSNDYFTASCEDAKFGSNPFTVSLWVYPTSFSGERALYDALVLGGAGARANAFVLVQVATTGKLRIFTAGSYGTSSLGALTLNAWNHIALKRTGNTAYYYINGNLDTNTGREIIEIFQQLKRDRGITVVFVTHDPEVAACTERIVRLRDGLVTGEELTTETCAYMAQE